MALVTGSLAAVLALTVLLGVGVALSQPAEFALVPAAAGDVHDLDGLRVMGEALTGPDADTPTGTPRTRVLPARRG